MPPLPSTLTPLAATAAQKQIPISFLKLLELRRHIQEQSTKAVTRNDALVPSLLDRIFNS